MLDVSHRTNHPSRAFIRMAALLQLRGLHLPLASGSLGVPCELNPSFEFWAIASRMAHDLGILQNQKYISLEAFTLLPLSFPSNARTQVGRRVEILGGSIEKKRCVSLLLKQTAPEAIAIFPVPSSSITPYLAEFRNRMLHDRSFSRPT